MSVTISIDTANYIVSHTTPHEDRLGSEEGVEEGLAGSLGRLGLLLVLLGLDALLLDCGRTSSAPIKLGSLVYTHEAPGDGRS